MRSRSIESIKQRIGEIRSEYDFIKKMKIYVFASNQIFQICNEYLINIQDIHSILESDNIELGSVLSDEQKNKFIYFMQLSYESIFQIEITRRNEEKHKPKKYSNSSPYLRKKALSNKQQLLLALEKGFESNPIGIFEKMRIEKITELKSEIQLLKRMAERAKNNRKEKNVNYKKPRARMILTPMGGKVD
jgi:hypothetical protein